METLKVLRAEPHIDSVVAVARVRRDKMAQSLQMRQQMVVQVMSGPHLVALTTVVAVAVDDILLQPLPVLVV
jgi:hypothetical protein